MKLLILFSVACVAMLVIVVWQLIPRDVRPTSSAAPPPQVEKVGVEARRGGEKPAVTSIHTAIDVRTPSPTSSATREPACTSQPTVRWPTEPDRRQCEEQLASALQALSEDAENPAALRDAADALRALGRWEVACRYLAQLVATSPNDTATRFEYATALMRTNQWVDAVRALTIVVEREPGHAQAWYNLAIAHQTLGHLQDARIAWNRTIELMPENPDAYAHRGEVLLDMHDWSAAATDFETVLQTEPADIDAALNLSLALWRSGRLQEARQRVAVIVAGRPRHVPALNRLAELCWAQCQNGQQARSVFRNQTIEYARRSLEIDPNQPEIADLLAAAERWSGKAAR